MGMIQEFKKFALRGNMVDMAVGIVIGGAFGTIVKSLVDDILMPPLGVLTGNVDFTNLKLPITNPVVEKLADGTEKIITPAVTINYGAFINSVIAFLIVAWAVFLVVKAMNAAQSRLSKEEEEQPAPAPPEDVLLLREIRDSLKKA